MYLEFQEYVSTEWTWLFYFCSNHWREVCVDHVPGSAALKNKYRTFR